MTPVYLLARLNEEYPASQHSTLPRGRLNSAFLPAASGTLRTRQLRHQAKLLSNEVRDDRRRHPAEVEGATGLRAAIARTMRKNDLVARIIGVPGRDYSSNANAAGPASSAIGARITVEAAPAPPARK
jgi:hypothetical protein